MKKKVRFKCFKCNELSDVELEWKASKKKTTFLLGMEDESSNKVAVECKNCNETNIIQLKDEKGS